MTADDRFAAPLEITAGPYRGFVHARFKDQAAELAAVFAAGRSPLDGAGASIIHEGRNRLGVVSWPWMIAGFPRVVVKEFGFRGLNRLKSLFGASKAARAWRGATALVERGLPTPFPVAFLEERKGGLVSRGCFVAAWVPDAREVRDLFRGLEGDGLGRLLKELAPFLRECHDKGILHRDLSDGNVLVKGAEAGGDRFFLIDTNRIRVRRRIGRRARVRNLVRLGVPAGRQREFLDLYLGEGARTGLWFAYYRARKGAYAGAVALKKKLRLRALARKLRIQ